MIRRPRVTDATDHYSEFLEEHPGLWPQRDHDDDAVNPFNEFVTEIEPKQDRWLTVARGAERSHPPVHDYRHMLTVASVLVGLFTPAGVISTIIVGRELTVSPMELSDALPRLPAGSLTDSAHRLLGIPALATLPSPPPLPAEAIGGAVRAPSLPRDPNISPAPSLGQPAPAPSAVLPLTTAILSAFATDAGLSESQAPGSSDPAPAAANVPGAPPAAAVVPPPTAAVSPTTDSAAPGAPPGTSADRAAVRAALERYREAFSILDAGGAKSVWPAVDEKTLTRAFSQVVRQEFVFDACSVEVTGTRATASCRGRAQYVPKVGSRSPRVEVRHWTFTLWRAATQWTIESVDSR